jgi:hypothetical protein
MNIYDNVLSNYFLKCEIFRQSRREIQNTLSMINNFFFQKKFDEIKRKSVVEPGRPQTTIRRMRIACCITKASDTNSQGEIYTDSHGNNG